MKTMSMLNINVVGLIFGGLMFGGGGLIFGMWRALVYVVGLYWGWGAYIWGGGTYIWNEVSVSICGGLIFGGGL